MSTQVQPTRHALGWPPGSVRAMLALGIVGLVCALMLIPPREGEPPTPIPAYLRYLLFLVLGHYFGARGSARDQSRAWSQQPLYLPRGCIRFLLLASLTATTIFCYTNDPERLQAQWVPTGQQSLHEVLVLPLVVLLAFFAGSVFAMVFGHHSWAWVQDLEAWLSLIAMLLLGVAALIHLLNLSLPQPFEPTVFHGILAGVVAFYFGARS